MINETFYSKRLKCMVRQISKQAARKLWDEGKEIFFLPSYMSFDNAWMRPMEAAKNGFSFQGYTFDHVCDNYETFNCDSFRGRYIHFYIKEN